MKVKGYKVGRIVPIESLGQYKKGQLILQPQPNINPNYSSRKLMIESMFEKIRVTDYPNLPSRQNSLFVFPIDDVKFREEWLNILYPHQNVEYVLLTLSLTGELLWFDSDFYNDCLLFESDPSKFEEQARLYWEPKDDYNLPQIEGLFVGTAIIENIEIKTRYRD